MFYKELLEKTVKYYDSSLIALILSFITIPTLWYISHGNLSWVLSCGTIWALGVFIIFQPMIRYIYPYMITQLGTVSLTFILSILSIFLNTVIILWLLPKEDIEIVINNTIYSSSISNLFLFLWFYIIISGLLLSNLDFRINTLYVKPKQALYKFSSNFVISKYFLNHFIEIGLIFLLPIMVLFWTDITYSFRILLGILSMIIGLSLSINRLKRENQKLFSIVVYIGVVFLINGVVISSIGIDRIPNSNIDNNQILLNLEAKNIDYSSFQLTTNKENGTTNVYKILASIPSIGLYIGHKVGTISNKQIGIKATDTQYTIYDQYNNKRIMSLDK